MTDHEPMALDPSFAENTDYRQIGDTPFAIPSRITVQRWGHPYDVEVTIVNDDGSPQCTELTIKKHRNGIPVTAEGLRRISLPDLVQHVITSNTLRLRDPSAGVAGGFVYSDDHDQAAALDAADGEKREARRRITDDDLRAIAEIYLRARRENRSYIALAALELGWTHDEIKQRKRKAKAAGFIPD